ncbi:MAG: BamA/TamA family outer membrane protein [Chitinophagales bacterium]
MNENEYLYKGSEIAYDNIPAHPSDTDALRHELLNLSKLEENEKTLGLIPLKMQLYVLGDTGIDHYIRYQEVWDTKFFFFFDYANMLHHIPPLANDSSKFRKWLMYTVGEAPQILDTTAIEETNSRITNYLYNRGYFNGTCDYHVVIDSADRSGKVVYDAHLNTMYRMRNIHYEIADTYLLNKIEQIPDVSPLATGKPFDVDLLKKERNRISDNLRDLGYYTFQKEYVYFEVDTSSRRDSLDIYVKISNPANDTMHHPYKIRNIYTYPNASIDFNDGILPEKMRHYVDSVKLPTPSKSVMIERYHGRIHNAEADSIYAAYQRNEISKNEALAWYVVRDSSESVAYTMRNNVPERMKRYRLRSDYYLINSKKNYTARSISSNIFLNPGNYYSDSLIQKTVYAFSSLGIYKYVTIQSREIPDSTGRIHYIDLYIKLDPLPSKSVSYELNASTTSDYLLGNSVNFSYTHKNLFHQLDQFKVHVKGGIETQLGGEQAFINTSEFNAGVSLLQPSFMWPFYVKVPKRYFPKTNISLNFNYVDQVNDFTLYNTSFEYAISIFENTRADKAQKQHIFKLPIPTVNIVKVPRISPAFEEELNQNPLLRQSFEEQVIMGYGYTFILNTQPKGFHTFDQYLRATAEINMPFSDFVRMDGDYRSYFNLKGENKIVGRTALGFAVPFYSRNQNDFLDTRVIPYVKEFFTGGAYSVRAFTVRKLGPGAYVDYDTATYTRIDQVGDMKLEFNLEYRFDIFSLMKGALFCDVGNTFTLKADPFRPHAEFRFDSFYKELAVGPGAGIRFDFSYFVIRFDAAYPLYDPALDGPYKDEYRSYYDDIGFDIPQKKVAFNLAIGYPF